MTSDELNNYSQEVRKECGECTILTAERNLIIHNAGNTSSRKALNGADWIDLWQALSGNHSHILYCSSCGKKIIVGQATLQEYLEFCKNGDSIEKHKACGGHLWITAPQDADYTGGWYITPLCPACNNKREQDIQIRKGSILCKELGANKKE